MSNVTLTGISPNDMKVNFQPPHPSYFPDIYLMERHPKNKGQGRSFYYVQDGSLEAMAKIYELENTVLKVPNNGEDGASAQGNVSDLYFFLFLFSTLRLILKSLF